MGARPPSPPPHGIGPGDLRRLATFLAFVAGAVVALVLWIPGGIVASAIAAASCLLWARFVEPRRLTVTRVRIESPRRARGTRPRRRAVRGDRGHAPRSRRRARRAEGGDLWVAGVGADQGERAVAALGSVPAGFPVLFLHHFPYPEVVPESARDRVDLMLSGHVHGGQVALPACASSPPPEIAVIEIAPPP